MSKAVANPDDYFKTFIVRPSIHIGASDANYIAERIALQLAAFHQKPLDPDTLPMITIAQLATGDPLDLIGDALTQWFNAEEKRLGLPREYSMVISCQYKGNGIIVVQRGEWDSSNNGTE